MASLLKPVDDVRMFEKFGIAIASTGNYEVHIVGFNTHHRPPAHPHINFHPLFNFSRLSMRRALAPWYFYIFLLKVKPDLIVANSHDLLIVTVLYKILFGSKILYDIQENYFLNILHTDAFPGSLRGLVAFWTRIKETLCAPFFSHFFLAEKVYEKQLSFIGNRYTLLENKYNPLFPTSKLAKRRLNPGKTLQLLYTGTVADHYGALEAIRMANNISTIHPVELSVIGRCVQEDFLEKIRAETAQNSAIRLQVGKEPVSHPEIIQAMLTADMAIVTYKTNKSLKGRIPTKIYEYIANNLPFIVINDQDWIGLPAKYRACVVYNEGELISSLLKKVFSAVFYDTKRPLDEIFWDSERQKLIATLERLLK